MINTGFPNFKIEDISEFPHFQNEPTVYEIEPVKNITLRILSHIRPNPEFIVVLFNGATNNERDHSQPNFMRWSWAEEHKFSFISIDDPIVSNFRTTNLAWYVGTDEFDLQKYINNIINTILTKVKLSTNNVVFYGSSGGGFAAIMAATILKGSSAVVNNPQTDILKYSKRFVELFSTCFGKDEQVIRDHYYYRFCLIRAFKHYNYIPSIYYRQNSQDLTHVRNHYIPFLSSYLELVSTAGTFNNKLTTELFHDDRGHSSFSTKEMFKEEILAIHASSSNNDKTDISIERLQEIELERKITWIETSNLSNVHNVNISGTILTSSVNTKCKPALLAINTQEYDYHILKEAGLSYSRGLKCAFMYIEVEKSRQDFNINIPASLYFSKIGFMEWKSPGKVFIKRLKIGIQE
ncbi:hypothetical protein ACNPAA_17710 [Aeromonas sp. PS2Canimalfood6]|uniref:hypothetical protein n=1 Tax=Aeromonas sp. PS2Canimalfood6 TaxID=3397770 RepID=UPI003AA9CDEC